MTELSQEHFDQQLNRFNAHFDKLDQRFDKLYAFLETKVALKEDIASLRESIPTMANFNELQKSVDAYAKQSKDYDVNVKVALSRLEQIEAWIKDAAPKIGIEFKQ